ncbi:major capsid protein [robinz microvirus RP_109]|nr:major capsid protein [robinz microvirus RP_109]
MRGFMNKNRSVSTHAFAMIPKAEIPRASFRVQTAHKTTFDAGILIPFFCTEVLPGDSFNFRATTFARMSTPLFPVMDNAYMDMQYFYVPNRIIWDDWVKLQGEQDNPGDSTDYTVPVIQSASGGFANLSIYDYLGLPTEGQIQPAAIQTINALPLRAINKIWNEWYRDENLQDRLVENRGPGPDLYTDYNLFRRNKRHDYFTSCLPFLQKGPSIGLPLGSEAPVFGLGTKTAQVLSGNYTQVDGSTFGAPDQGFIASATGDQLAFARDSLTGFPRIYADLSQATAATINQLRQAFQIQRMLERDARGGTRYTEALRQRWGVSPPDARLQRPEFLGSGSCSININPIAQTSGTAGAGGYTDTPQGNLAAMGTATGSSGFTQSFTEHGWIIGFVSVRADLTYQQGQRKMWSRLTRADHYEPVFSHLGEQAVLNKEIYSIGGGVQDEAVFGYVPRWDEYRHQPSMITGLFRSTHPQTIDAWHWAQNFTALPTLNDAFIQEFPPFERTIAVGAVAAGQQFIFDSFVDIKMSRQMPMFSVPGMIDRF